MNSSSLYHYLLKPILFKMDAEKAHQLTMKLMKMSSSLPLYPKVRQSKHFNKIIDGLEFKNPVGLAAGFDKDGKYFNLMSRLGFGFIEVGTVTPKPQVGNPRPRLFRLKEDRALINRMGFNNDGADALARRLEDSKSDRGFVLGINIGKNKSTPNEIAYKDYEIGVRKLHTFADYFTVNVSSPNTPGLRELQGKEALYDILKACQDQNLNRKPIYLKIAPELNESQIVDVIQIVADSGSQGIISNNTSITRQGLQANPSDLEKIGAGGLSGRPIQSKSDEVLGYLLKYKPDEMTLIASGGVHSVQSAVKKLDMGAHLVQVYTGLIYNGPSFVSEILDALK